VRTIKKYVNRRLYDPTTSRYITLRDLEQMVLERISFQVVDGRSGIDMTPLALLQILMARQEAGRPALSCELMIECIRATGAR
jgi:polyhydroxyalkanoate synthesis repressor PhaR